MQTRITAVKQDILRLFTFKKMLFIIIGSVILSFGLYNIHQQAGITEGGVLGILLLLDHWFHIPPSLATPLLDACCYLLGYRFLGKDFLKVSIIATLCCTVSFRLWEQLPYMLPNLATKPLLAAVAGALFVGIGVGLIVRQGASSCGDDALAMVISKVAHIRISPAYLVTDLTVLLLSLTYLPLKQIACSLITVILSSLIIEGCCNLGRHKHKLTGTISV